MGKQCLQNYFIYSNDAHIQDGFENCVLHDGGSRGGGSPDSGSGTVQLRSLRCRGSATSNTTALQHP